MRYENNKHKVHNSAFRRIIIISNERSGWIASACALSWARMNLCNSNILIADHTSGMDLPHTVVPLTEVCNSHPGPMTTLRSTTMTVPGMFLALCGDSEKIGFENHVSFLTNLEFHGEKQHFVADVQNDLFVYISALDDTGDIDHKSLCALHSVSGGGNLLLLADRATQRSAWEAALKLPGWRVLGCWVSGFGPPSIDHQLTRAFVKHSDWSKGTIECVSLGVALGVVKYVPFRFRSPLFVVPLDVAASTALVASLLHKNGELEGPFTNFSETTRSMSFYIPANALVWGMFAEYLLDYYKQFNVEVTGALPIPHLIDPTPTLQLRSSLSDWANYGFSLMKPLQSYYIYSANNRRKMLCSYYPASVAGSRIAFAITNIDKTVRRLVAESEVTWPENGSFEFYTKLLGTVGESCHMRPLLLPINMFSVRWDIYVKTIAQTIVETVISRIIDVPAQLLPSKPIYNNDIVFACERRSPKTFLTPRRYCANLHWMLRFGMNANGVRMNTTPGLTKDREELILKQDNVNMLLDKIAEEKKVSKEELLKQSRVILRTIGDTLNQYHIRIIGIMVRKVFFKLYNEVTINEEAFERLNRVMETPRAQVVLIPAHRSYMDFLILTYLLAVMGLSPPHICSGDGFLRMGPIATLMRGSGGFFMRRSFRGDQLYHNLFGEYIRQLVLHRQMLEFFIEGMRSRSGKMLTPKLGILKYVTDTFFEKQNVLDDVYFVPVSLSYDELLEAELYADEELGTSKPKENIGNLIRARTLLKKKHGSIHVYFGEPLSLRQFRDTPNMCPSPLKSVNASHEQEMESMKNVYLKTPPHILRNLAWHISHSIEENTVVTPTALLAINLITLLPKSVVSVKETERRMVWLRSHMARRKVPLSSECTVTEASELTQRGIRHLSRFLKVTSPGNITVLQNITSFLGLSICSNELIHVLLDEAVIAVAARACGESDAKASTLRAHRTTLEESCRELRKLLAMEFPRYLPWCPYTFDSWFDNALSRLLTLGKDDCEYGEVVQSSLLHHSTRTSDLDTAAFVTIPMNSLFQLMIRMMSPFIEVLYIVSLGVSAVAESGEAVLRKSAFLKACHAFGLSLHNADGSVVYSLLCNKSALKNALESIANVSDLQIDLKSSDSVYVPRGEIASSVLLAQIQPVLKKLLSFYMTSTAKSIQQDDSMARRSLLELYQKQLADTKKISKI